MADFNDYILALKSGTVKPLIKIEWLRNDETTESELVEDILDGSLTINRNNGIRRTIDFTVKNSPSLLPNVYNIWLKKKVRLSLGVNTNNGDYFIPQGVFVLSNPTYTSSPSGSTVSFSANDKFSILSGENGFGLLQDIYLINNGTNINTAISSILTAFGDPISPVLRASTMTFPYTIRKGQGDNIGSMIQEICLFSARNGYYDNTGRFVFEDDIVDEVKSSLWDFNFQDDNYTYLGSNLEHKFSDVRNVVKVIGDNINGLIAVGIAKDTDLTSPTNISILGEIAEVVQNNYIQANADALRLAQYMLKRLKVLNSAISIQSMPMYHLDVDSVITITDPNLGLETSRYLITSINLNLGFGGTMSISAVKTSEPNFFVGKVG